MTVLKSLSIDGSLLYELGPYLSRKVYLDEDGAQYLTRFLLAQQRIELIIQASALDIVYEQTNRPKKSPGGHDRLLAR